MINTHRVYAAWRNDKARHRPNQLGPGYLTRDERWAEVMRYCRRQDAMHRDDDAKHIASMYGRDWSDMGEYERQSYRDEANRRKDERGMR